MAYKETSPVIQGLFELLGGMQKSAQTGLDTATKTYSELEAKKMYDVYKGLMGDKAQTKAAGMGLVPSGLTAGDTTFARPESETRRTGDAYAGERLKLQTLRERRLAAKDEFAQLQANNKMLIAEGRYDESAKRNTFHMAMSLYNTLYKENQFSQDSIMSKQKEDALMEVMRAADEAGISVGQYEVFIPEDDRSWLNRFLGRGEAPKPGVREKGKKQPIPNGMVEVINSAGVPGYIPKEELQGALKQGYRKVEE